MPVAFDTSGMEQYDDRTWFDPRTGDQVSLTYIGLVPDLPAGLDDLPLLRHRLALETAEVGALIEAHVVFIDQVPTLFQLLKVPIPNQDSGQAFIAAFTVPKATCSVVLRIQCAEGSTTGVREATIFGQVGVENYVRPHPYAPDLTGRLPWHVADDAQWDAKFPDHPLSRARVWANKTMASARLDPGFAQLPPFRPTPPEPDPTTTFPRMEPARNGHSLDARPEPPHPPPNGHPLGSDHEPASHVDSSGTFQLPEPPPTMYTSTAGSAEPRRPSPSPSPSGSWTVPESSGEADDASTAARLRPVDRDQPAFGLRAVPDPPEEAGFRPEEPFRQERFGPSFPQERPQPEPVQPPTPSEQPEPRFPAPAPSDQFSTPDRFPAPAPSERFPAPESAQAERFQPPTPSDQFPAPTPPNRLPTPEPAPADQFPTPEPPMPAERSQPSEQAPAKPSGFRLPEPAEPFPPELLGIDPKPTPDEPPRRDPDAAPAEHEGPHPGPLAAEQSGFHQPFNARPGLHTPDPIQARPTPPSLLRPEPYFDAHPTPGPHPTEPGPELHPADPFEIRPTPRADPAEPLNAHPEPNQPPPHHEPTRAPHPAEPPGTWPPGLHSADAANSLNGHPTPHPAEPPFGTHAPDTPPAETFDHPSALGSHPADSQPPGHYPAESPDSHPAPSSPPAEPQRPDRHPALNTRPAEPQPPALRPVEPPNSHHALNAHPAEPQPSGLHAAEPPDSPVSNTHLAEPQPSGLHPAEPPDSPTPHMAEPPNGRPVPTHPTGPQPSGLHRTESPDSPVPNTHLAAPQSPGPYPGEPLDSPAPHLAEPPNGHPALTHPAEPPPPSDPPTPDPIDTGSTPPRATSTGARLRPVEAPFAMPPKPEPQRLRAVDPPARNDSRAIWQVPPTDPIPVPPTNGRAKPRRTPEPPVDDVMHTVLVGLPIGGYLPLWQNSAITYWRMAEPDVVRDRLGVGLESRSEIDDRRFREAAMFSPDKHTLFLMDRFRDRTGRLGGTTTQLLPATEEEAHRAADDKAMSELYRWLGEIVLAAGKRGEFVAVETGGWSAPSTPVVLIMLRTDGDEWHSVVETSPVPVGAPVWRDQQPVDGDTQLLVSPATDQTMRAAGLLTRFAVGTWSLHPFQLGLSFGPNPTLGEMPNR